MTEIIDTMSYALACENDRKERRASPELLDALWCELQHLEDKTPPPWTPPLPKEPYVALFELDDWLIEIAPGSDLYHHAHEILWLSHVPVVMTAYRPRRITTDVILHDEITIEGATKFLIVLERAGLPANPLPWAEHVLRRSANDKTISDNVLDAFWHARTRQRLGIEWRAPPSMQAAAIRQLKTAHGYKVMVWLTADGKPTIIETTGPKYRTPPRQEEVICEICRAHYTKGDRASTYDHRRYHKKVMAVIEPQPDPRLTPNSILEVTVASPRWAHRLLHQRAAQFRRENRYDFVQWGDPDNDPRGHGFLFVDDQGAAVGGCAFRWRKWEAAPHGWALTWIWLAPCARRKGVLSRQWPQFRATFGDFLPEPPYSQAMKEFLRKHQPELVAQ